MPDAFGTRLLAALEQSGLKAADLARLCDVRRQTVGKWLRMREARLEARHAACIARATRTDLSQLIEGDPELRRKRRYSGRMALISAKNRAIIPVACPCP